MRVSRGVLAVVCTVVAVAGAPLVRAQEATSANLPDQFGTGEVTPPAKSKKKKAESISQTVATAPKQKTASAPQQTPPAEELPTLTVPSDEKKGEPSPAVEAKKSNTTSAHVTKSAPAAEESEPVVVPVGKKPRLKKRARAAVQPEVASMPAPVPISLSVAQSMAISAPLPDYPYEAKRRNLSGSGVCVVTVDPATGRVTNATMFQSTGSAMLDKLTTQTFTSWRFKPGTVSQVRVPISYE
jgi:TonB family protein